MKKLLTGIFAFICIHAFAQTKINEAIGGTGDDEAIYATPTNDGGYVIVGWTTSYGVWGWDIYLAKTDSLGNLLWTRTYGANGDEVDCFVQQTADGGFVITARSNSFGAGSADVYLIKTDGSGMLQWSRTIGGSDWEEGHAIVQTDDGGYIHCGYTKSFGAGGDDFYVIRNNANGDLMWTKTFGGTGDEHAHFIQKTNDGGYILGGETNSFGAGGWDYYLVKTDVNGNQQWSKTYGGTGDDHGWSVVQTSDNGYIMGGFSNSFGAGGDDYCLVKTDVNGNVEWTKTFGGTNADQCYMVRQCADGGYILTGSTTSFGSGSTDILLVKTDANGNQQWSKTYGGSGDEKSQSAQQMPDGGFLLAGYTSSFGNGSRDFYMIKTDANGNSGGCYEAPASVSSGSAAVITHSPTTIAGSGGTEGTPQTLVNGGGARALCTPAGVEPGSSTQNSFSIYPNPSSDFINVNYVLEKGQQGIVRIFDASGQMIGSKNVSASENSTKISAASLANGVYTCTLVVDGKDQQTGKFVIRK